MLWHKQYTIDDALALITHDNILDHLGLEFTEIGDDFITARLPVDRRTHQIHGILHGGATCVLAETIGSFASIMCVDLDHKYAVGSQISVNHLRPASEGYVHAHCAPVHIGRTKHVWDIRVSDDRGRLVAKCELSCAVIDKPKAA